MEEGALTFELIDDDGEELPGKWQYTWSGRDPLELTIYTVTELSGKPWKWSSRSRVRARISPRRCHALKVRVGKLLRKESRMTTANVMARVIAQECLRPGQRMPDAKAIAEILAGKRDVDWDAGPQETAPGMLRALRAALKAAVEVDAGLQIAWE